MTLGKLVEINAAQRPEQIALWAGDRSMSYRELEESTTRIANWLFDQGMRPGDRMAIQWPNSIEAVQLYFAAFRAGIVAVPVNLRLKPAEIAYVLEHSGATLCISAPAFARLAEQAGASCRMMAGMPEGGSMAPLPDADPDRPAVIIYTSGTTARPKGAVHTHRTMMACVRGAVNAKVLAGGGVSLVMTPMMHVAGLAMAISAFHAGHTAVLVSFDPATVLDAIERHRCTFFFVLPALGLFMVEEQARSPRDVSSLQICVAGGDSVSVNLQRRFKEHFGLPLLEGYGLTEGGILAVNQPDAICPGSLGQAVPGVEIRLTDPAGRDVAEGEPGEILARSEGSCAGYWNDPETTANLLRGGWLHTGDLATRDADGYLWFKGRSKQIIVRAGSNISPQEVEEALYQHPAVLEVGVVGKPDPVYGELVLAFVALRSGYRASEAELQAFARERLADYKTPEEIVFLPELPKGLTGKVDRRTLKGMVRAPEMAMSAA